MVDMSLRKTYKKTKLVRSRHSKPTKRMDFFNTLFPKANDLNPAIELLTAYTSDTIYRLNYATMKYEYISPAVYDLLGYSEQEMQLMCFADIVTDSKVFKALEVVSIKDYQDLVSYRKIDPSSKWEADYSIKKKNGDVVWVSDISHPWYDQNGQIIGAIGYLRDITSRVRAEESAREELIMLANTDPLTKLANRRYFFQHLDLELKRAQRSGRDLSVLLLDLDHFKNINDTYGHFSGDQVLAIVSNKINECLRDTDIAARLGGEEFGIFLPDTPISSAYWVAERICSSIAKHKFVVSGHEKPIRCTVSIGVSCSSVSATHAIDDLYKLADTRLYIAKNTGRNQVSLDEFIPSH